MKENLIERVNRISQEQGLQAHWQMDVVFAKEAGLLGKLKTTDQELLHNDTASGYLISQIIEMMNNLHLARHSDVSSFRTALESVVERLSLFRRENLYERIKTTYLGLLWVFRSDVRADKCLKGFVEQFRKEVIKTFNMKQRDILNQCRKDFEIERCWRKHDQCKGYWNLVGVLKK